MINRFPGLCGVRSGYGYLIYSVEKDSKLSLMFKGKHSVID